MEAQDPLSQLADIHLPEAVGFWPPAFGWWILTALTIGGIFYLTRASLRSLVRRKRLGNALSELENCYRKYQEHSVFGRTKNQASLNFLNQLNAILRRVSLALYPDAKIAGLSGAAWLDFLDQCDNGKKFSQGCGQILEDGIYRKNIDGDIEALNTLAIHWIENCYLEALSSNKASPEPEVIA